ncbi:MAG: hypothetical protein KC415_09745 [Anaerolineales bacterium]|nr:hypothetical protein [Anaerolineales bacterium]
MLGKQYYFTIIGIVLALITVLVGFHHVVVAEEVMVFSDSGPEAVETEFANCRYGAVPLSSDQFAKIGELGAGWILNFGVNSSVPVTSNNAQYVPIIRIREERPNGQYNGVWYLNFDTGLTGVAAEAYVKSRVAALPAGMLWLVGNEIERLYQDNITPATYADAYHDIYHWIKEVDPSAQVAISGLVEVTPLRLVYLDMIWEAYLDQFGMSMPVDVWNMHLYPIPEVQADGVTPGAASIPEGVDLMQTTAVPKQASDGNSALCSQSNVYCYAEHDDMAVFAEQVTMMRQWMKEKGQQQKPLIISEFSILWLYVDSTGDGQPDYLRDEYGLLFTPQRVASFMQQAFDYLENTKDPNLGYALDDNRLVQQWMWYALHAPWRDLDDDGVRDYGNWEAAPSGNSSDLYWPINPPGDMTLQRTLIGDTFRNHVSAIAPTQNLVIDRVDSLAYARPVTVPTTITATLQVLFRNVGNTAVSTPFAVSFYDQNDALIGSVDMTDLVGGCGVYPYTVSLDWPIDINDMNSQVIPFTVRVDSGGVISEVSEADNVAEGFVIINANNLFLPTVHK